MNEKKKINLIHCTEWKIITKYLDFIFESTTRLPFTIGLLKSTWKNVFNDVISKTYCLGIAWFHFWCITKSNKFLSVLFFFYFFEGRWFVFTNKHNQLKLYYRCQQLRDSFEEHELVELMSLPQKIVMLSFHFSSNNFNIH